MDRKFTQWQKKLIVISATVIILIGLLAAALLTGCISLSHEVSEEDVTVVEDVVADHFSEVYVNVEDDAIMKKGKLLNKDFETEYNKLPETLYTLEYGDYLYTNFTDGANNDFWFSLVENNSLDELNKYEGTSSQEPLVNYLKLVAKNAVSPPVHECLNCGSLVDLEEFYAYYKDEFSKFGMSRLPIKIKNKIIKFYSSSEGKNFRYVEKGNQTSADLIWSGNLTGSGKNEYAILFKDTQYELSDNYLLLVYAANNTDYYLVYNERFYEKVLLGHLKTSSDGEESSRSIYMNTNHLVETENDGIVLKQINRADAVLVYNKDFDKLVKFIQRPAADTNHNGDEEGEEYEDVHTEHDE